jgi:acyl-CoA-binding protein
MFSWQRASFDVEHVRLRVASMHLLRLNQATRDAGVADRAIRFPGDFRLVKRLAAHSRTAG